MGFDAVLDTLGVSRADFVMARRRRRSLALETLGARCGIADSYWKVIMSVRLSVADVDFKGSLLRLDGF